uniref:ATP synthase subunit alpha n=1 Tax=Hyalogonium fusiforme TaxID=2926373 RepID=A0A9E8ADW5_9CHLO|nr:ATP synthase subunit alpha [Hyalogonium fusiforme]
MSLAEQVVSIYTGTNGYLDSLAVEDVRGFLVGLRTFVATEHKRFNEILNDTQTLTPEAETILKQAISAYKAAL